MRLLPRRERTGLAYQRPDQADHSEFSPEPYRWGTQPRRHRAYRRSHRRPQRDDSLRRNLQPPAIRRRTAFFDYVGRWYAGAYDPSRRLLEDIRHDRLAYGIRRHAPRSR